MKNIKHVLVVVLIILISGLIFTQPGNPILMFITLLLVGFFIFNLVIRKSLSFKSYFTSNYNLFTTKFKYKKSFDISKDLMFQKLIEVINNSNFKLVDKNEEKFEILAIAPITFKSWGENLYINFDTEGNETVMNFCSATLFQMYAWGKNEKNYNDLLLEIENSFII